MCFSKCFRLTIYIFQARRVRVTDVPGLSHNLSKCQMKSLWDKFQQAMAGNIHIDQHLIVLRTYRTEISSPLKTTEIPTMMQVRGLLPGALHTDCNWLPPSHFFPSLPLGCSNLLYVTHILLPAPGLGLLRGMWLWRAVLRTCLLQCSSR